MAYITPANILTRIRELVDSAAGLSRTISSSRFSAEWNAALSRDEQSRRAMDKPRFDVVMTKLERTPHTMPSSNIGMWNVGVRVTVARHLNVQHKVVETLRDDVLTLANIDADMIAQALGYLGNARVTSGASATGLVGGKLELVESTHNVQLDREEASLVLTEHEFAGILTVVHDTGGASGETSMYSMDAVSDAQSNGYYSQNVGFLRGATTMTWAAVFYLETVPTVGFGQSPLVVNGDISSGNPVYFLTNEGTFYFRIRDGLGTLYGSPAKTFTAADEGKFHTAVATYSSNVLRLYVNGTQIGSGDTTGGGITQNTADKGIGFLRQYSGGGVNPFYWLVGAGMSETTALSPAQAAVWHTLSQTQFACATFSGIEYLWNMRDNPTAAATWSAQRGSQTMLRGDVATTFHSTPFSSVVWGT